MPFTGGEKWVPVLLRVMLGDMLFPHGAQKLWRPFKAPGRPAWRRTSRSLA